MTDSNKEEIQAKVDESVDKLGEALSQKMFDITEQPSFQKAKKKFLDTLWEDFEYSIIDYLPHQLEWFVKDMATKTVTAIIEGDEGQMRRYLLLNLHGYNGRDHGDRVIHGELFETGAIELRKKMAQAHAELIQNERILDLESQVEGLVKQVNEKDSVINELQRGGRL